MTPKQKFIKWYENKEKNLHHGWHIEDSHTMFDICYEAYKLGRRHRTKEITEEMGTVNRADLQIWPK